MKNKHPPTVMPALVWNGQPWQGSCTVRNSSPPVLDADGPRLALKNAVLYGMQVIRDRLLSAFYLSFCRDKNSVRRTAMMDYKHGPVIHSIVFEQQDIGYMIYIDARDNVKVDAVKVITYDMALKQQEAGLAVYNEETAGWEYTLTTAGMAQVKVIATDIPGNKVTAIIQFD